MCGPDKRAAAIISATRPISATTVVTVQVNTRCNVYLPECMSIVVNPLPSVYNARRYA